MHWRLLHVVAVGARLNRTLLLGHFPSAWQMRTWRHLFKQQEPAPGAQLPAATERRGTNSWHGLPAHKILQWVDATKYIKKLTDCHKAAAAWSNLFFADTGHSVGIDAVMPRSQIVNKESLRRARITTDVVAMLLWRLPECYGVD